MLDWVAYEIGKCEPEQIERERALFDVADKMFVKLRAYIESGEE